MAKWLQVTLDDKTTRHVNFDTVRQIYPDTDADEESGPQVVVDWDDETITIKATMEGLYTALGGGMIGG